MHDSDHHYRRIEQAVLAGASKAEAPWRTASWSRCLQEFKLSPTSSEMLCLGSRELREETEAFGEDLALANTELEATLGMIEGGGYSAHIANRNGIIIAERRSRDSTYNCSTDRLGAIWSEHVGGTNGIGTSIREQRATAVYLTDHFYADLTGQACAAAPIFDPYGEMLGVVNLSTRNPGVPQLAHRVVFGIAQATADRLETSYFRNLFRNCYTMSFQADQSTPALLAIDADYRILGATRAARKLFKLDDSAVGARSIWALFERPRGNPPIDQIYGKLKELRQLESGRVIGASLQKPTAEKTVLLPKTSLTKSPVQPNNARRHVTLAECAGSDPRMIQNISILQRIADSGLHVLLLGETGTGKDTLARALHNEGTRARCPFVAFNCAAVPESLIDSELFGYSAGAFTGASKDGNSGRIIEADKGTLFLDEVGDMPLQLQTRLLRFLETQEVSPLGGGKPRTVDIQVIAATHQDLQARVSNGTFRQDLYYRLAGAVISLPALRDRTDLREIIRNLLNITSPSEKIAVSGPAMDQLMKYPWPGNVRELRNVLTRASKLAVGKLIQPTDLMLMPVGLCLAAGEAGKCDHFRSMNFGNCHENGAETALPVNSSKQASDAAVRDAVVATIAKYGSDAVACSKALGVSRATLYRKLKQFDLSLS